MTYNNFLKIITKIVIYILVAGGAFIMILPFAWMIMTSLKTDGEVNSWPPTWTSKNFSSERELNLEVTPSTISSRGTLNLSEFRSLSNNTKFNENKVVYYINDDAVRRGKVSLNFENIDYTSVEDLQKVFNKINIVKSQLELSDSLNTIFMYDEENVENFEKIYFKLFSQSDGYFKKTSIGNSIKNNISSAIRFIDNMINNNINRLPYLRTNDNTPESQKEYIENRKSYLVEYLNSLKDELIAMQEYFDENARGMGIISEAESKYYMEKLNSYTSKIEKFEQDDILYRTNTLIEKNLLEPFVINYNSLYVFNDIKKTFEETQDQKIDSLNILFRIPTTEMMYNNFIEDFKSADFDEDIKEIVLNVIDESNIRTLKDLVTAEIESEMIEEISNNLADQSSEVSVYGNILRNLSESEGNFDNYKYILSFNNAKFLESKLPQKRQELERILKLRKSYDEFISDFSNFYNNSTSQAKILSESNYVDKILYKENSKIEIYFNGIISSWLLDEEPVSSVEFTFSEVLKNIFQNYVTAWNAAPFSQYYINTVLMATTTTVFEIIIASMAAFAFAKLNFWGKNIIFTLFLATMMVPGEVLLVPNYITISRFQWLDSYYALIVPWIVSVFAIFLLRQQFMTVPNDLWDAAKIDGSSSWRFLWTVMVPLSKPALLTGAL
jgi:multiple sugar transport system permease protein